MGAAEKWAESARRQRKIRRSHRIWSRTIFLYFAGSANALGAQHRIQATQCLAPKPRITPGSRVMIGWKLPLAPYPQYVCMSAIDTPRAIETVEASDHIVRFAGP